MMMMMMMMIDLDIGQQHLRETDVELLKTETNVGIEFFYEPNCK